MCRLFLKLDNQNINLIRYKMRLLTCDGHGTILPVMFGMGAFNFGSVILRGAYGFIILTAGGGAHFDKVRRGVLRDEGDLAMISLI